MQCNDMIWGFAELLEGLIRSTCVGDIYYCPSMRYAVFLRRGGDGVNSTRIQIIYTSFPSIHRYRDAFKYSISITRDMMRYTV